LNMIRGCALLGALYVMVYAIMPTRGVVPRPRPRAG
jgi:hypothetical protein